jgi:ABC-type molybdate transport system substrate-binding protein
VVLVAAGSQASMAADTFGLVVAAVIAALGAIIAAIIGAFNHKKLQDIKVSVDGRLDQALEEIADLKRQRDIKADQ